MAGSMTFFQYTTDAGDLFAIYCDESNFEGANGAGAAAPGPGVRYTIPRNVRPRYALYSSSDNLVTRKTYLATAGTNPAASLNDTISGETLTLKSTTGERVRRVQSIDTAQDDGDA